MFLNQRPSGNRRRMRCQHQLDTQRRGRGVQRIWRDASLEQACKGFVARASLRRRAGVAQIFTTTTNAVMLFGDVGKGQKVRKGARDRDGRFDRQRAEQLGKCIEITIASAASAFRQRPHALDDMKERRALTLPQRVAKDPAKKPDVFSQALMRIADDVGRHKSSLSLDARRVASDTICCIMATTDPRVDAYIQNAAPFARPILQHIRKSVHAGCPDVEETMKWSFPHFVYKGMLCSMASFKAHCSFGFWKGSLLQVPPNGTPMSQFGRITSLDDLPGSKELIRLVRQAASLNDDGVKIARPKRTEPRPAPKAPAELQKALTASAKASATFKALSPSHRREYIEWITEAKTEPTRKKRVATTIEWLAQGKSRNWKYERKK